MSPSALITAGLDQAFGLPSTMSWATLGPPIRSVRYSRYIRPGHWSPLAREMGEYPWLFSVATVESRPENVVGKVRPSLLKMGLL